MKPDLDNASEGMHVAGAETKSNHAGPRRTQPDRWELVIVIDGDEPQRGWRCCVADQARVIAADGGARHALREDVTPTDLIGDLDTLAVDEVETLAGLGVHVRAFDADKDDTDFELAARLADTLARGPDRTTKAHRVRRVLVVGGAGGRLDHALGNIAVLCGPHFTDFEVTALMGESVLQVARPGREVFVVGDPGDYVSLVPFAGPCTGVTTTGMAYGLTNASLQPTSSLGISNVIADPGARVTVRGGTLMVIEPAGVASLLNEMLQ